MHALRGMAWVGACAFLIAACSSEGAAADPNEADSPASTIASESATSSSVTTEAADTTSAPETTELAAENSGADDTVVPEAQDQCGLAVLIRFDEGAPRDRMTITNQSTENIALTAVEFDLSNSAGGIIFDTLDGGSGVEVFQDFQVEGGEAVLAETPVAEDGASSLRLDFSSFDQDQSFTFSIDVDDQLVDSDLGQIQVTGAELAGAEAFITTADGATVVAIFDDADTAEHPATC